MTWKRRPGDWGFGRPLSEEISSGIYKEMETVFAAVVSKVVSLVTVVAYKQETRERHAALVISL